MALYFNDTATKQGLVQEYERECGFQYGDVSGNPTLLAEFVAAANLTLDDFVEMAIKAEGRWQWDDSNQTDYPIITTNLVANQRDYTFLQDSSSNFILDVYRVFVANASGLFVEIMPVDVETRSALPMGNQSGVLPGIYTTDSFTNGQNATGTPARYDKMANAIFLDPIPSANVTGGLKVYVNRDASHFTASDTTKRPGVPSIFHKYFYLKPAMTYARRKSLTNYATIAAEVMKMEGDPITDTAGTIGTYYSRRNRDERPALQASRDSNK